MYDVLEEIRTTLETACTTQFKRYYIGKLEYPKKAELPALCIYGENTELVSDQLSTAKDKYRYTITIEIFSSIYQNVTTGGIESDLVMKTQKEIYEKMEARTNGIPDADTVLGALRRIPRLQGTNFLYNNDISIDYTERQIENSAYFVGKMTFSAVTVYNTRT